MHRTLTVVLILLAACLTTHAAVKPHALFTDGAVLQQGVPMPVWGTAAAGLPSSPHRTDNW